MFSGRQLDGKSDLGGNRFCGCLERSGFWDASALRSRNNRNLPGRGSGIRALVMMLSRLRGMGVGLKLDDFGFGIFLARLFAGDTHSTPSRSEPLLSFHRPPGQPTRTPRSSVPNPPAGLARFLWAMDMVAEGIEKRKPNSNWAQGPGVAVTDRVYFWGLPHQFPQWARLKELLGKRRIAP